MRRLLWLFFLLCIWFSFLLRQPGFATTEETDSASFDETEIVADNNAMLLSAVSDSDDTSAQANETEASGWGLYFGLLHSHSTLSDGQGTAEEAFQQAAAVEGLDFFALTDHSNSFDNADSASISMDASTISADWAAGKAAAAAVTDADFVGLFGYEMSWANKLGHISTFCTPGFQSALQEGFDTQKEGLLNYYNALTTVPESISQFSHPGTFYGYFRNFEYLCEEYDRQITLLEVVSGDELPTAYDYYTKALDKGWHIAPTASGNEHDGQFGQTGSRTVVYAHSLTEEGIYDAMRSYRVYATEDCDLSIYYSMDGHFMGSRLKSWNLGDRADILVTLSDPTDAIGTVEVITEGGTSIARETVESNYATVSFSLDATYPYYYLRISQPDGDTAVTAPIWVESTEHAGISDFSCATALPVQGQTMDLALTLYNQEAAPLTAETVEIYADGALILSQNVSCTLLQGGSEKLTIPVICDELGQTAFTVSVTATLGSAERTYQQTLTQNIVMPDIVTSILVDGTHGNTESYTQLAAMAVENQIAVTTETAKITAEALENCSILLIGAPEIPFDAEFLTLVREFTQYGGSVILWGGGAEQNKLLEAIGATMRYLPGENGEVLSEFNKDAPWCEALNEDHIFLTDGSAIDPGSGTWLIRGDSAALAAEQTAAGGHIFAGCGPWLSDEALAVPKNIWDIPFANRMILSNILGFAEKQLPLSSIAEVRNGTPGESYRIRGFVTAGTGNPHNTFPNTLYIQDETGGIAAVSLFAEGISVGTPVEITGVLTMEGKNPVLEVVDFRVLDAAMYRYLPLTGPFHELMNNSLNGGRLVEVEGKVVTFRMNAENNLSELVLKDDSGNFATVFIEDYIFSGAAGSNDLAEEVRVGRTFRAIGIVHMRGDGVSVVRVRNCDEVVYVPLLTYYWEPAKPDNPRVGDSIGIWFAVMALSAGLLIDMRRKRIM